jgi:MoxR-like ATPase
MSADPLELIEQLQSNICRVVLGKEEVVRLGIVALLAGEHVLLEDVPGVGKTLVGKAMARSLSGQFHRIQFTPDLLPADITGSSLYNAQTREFTFSPGPVFANIVLADEINRATPRTQSALLEAMSERQVSADGQTYRLPQPFMVIATQNPIEFEGTYPLPESQLDRFLLRISVGYLQREVEQEVLTSHRNGEPVDRLEPALSCDQVVALQEAVRRVAVEDSINAIC